MPSTPYTRDDVINDLIAIIRAKPSEASPTHRLCEVRSARNVQYHGFPSKLRALSRLMQLMGWTDSKKKPDDADAEVTHDRLHSLLLYIRTKGQDEEIPEAELAEEWKGFEPPPDAATPLSERQEAFVQARLSGMNAEDAYTAAGYSGDASCRAYRINQHPAVQERLAGLRTAAEDAVLYKKHEAAGDLIAIVQASPSEANADHPLCETRMGPEGPYYRFPCKLAAITLLVRLMRWQDPAPVVFEAPAGPDRLDRLLEFIRTRP